MRAVHNMTLYPYKWYPDKIDKEQEFLTCEMDFKNFFSRRTLQ